MKASLLALLLLTVVPACKKKKEEPAAPPPAPSVVDTTTPTPTPPPAEPAGPKLDDAQVAAIVVAANQVDIDAGQLAIKKSKNAEVKKFAERMITDHTAVNKSAVDLVTKLKVTPVESEMSKSLVAGGADTRAKLEKLEGDAFDKAYVDNEVAAIVVAANQVDIDAGQLAIKKSKNPEVKKFAERMITDHTAVNKSAVDLVTKLKVTPVESEMSKSLVAGGADTRAKLEKLEGDAFDKAYVDNEVAYHEAVIGVLKTQLIPAATNAELNAALVGVQPAFDAHLEHAKQIQAALAGGGSAADHAHK